MSKYIPGNQKHLSLDDRKYIEKSLNQGLSFKETAKYLCKDPTTISKEVIPTFFEQKPVVIRFSGNSRDNQKVGITTKVLPTTYNTEKA